MKIGLCQLDIVWENKEENKRKAQGLVQKALFERVDTLLFPEMTLTGFSMNIQKTAEADDETLEFFKRLAGQNNINIGFGWVEAVESKAKNHYSIVSRTGALLSDYVKLHPFSYGGEDQFFEPGNGVSCFSIDGIKMSIFICYDLRFPEIFQAVSDNTEVIIVAANWPEPRRGHWRTLLQARAIENQVYIAGVNCVGSKGGLSYSGDSMIIDPEGQVLCELVNQESLIIADVSTDKVKNYREVFPLKADRKVNLYKSLL